MQDVVNVVLQEDDSVTRAIEKTAKRLEEKYSNKRKVNEKKLMKGTSKTKRVLTIIFDSVLVVFCLACCAIGISSFLFKINKLPPSFAGYSFMQVVSGSMKADGFDVGDNIIVKSVDTKSLNVGDNIAFYVYSKDYNKFYNLHTTLLNKEATQHRSNLTFARFFGVPSGYIKEAANHNARLVFHKIERIYQDETGMYWFKTKGSSNDSEDYWHVSENMVVGVHDDSNAAITATAFLKLISNNMFIVLLVGIPLICVAVSMVLKCIKRVQLAKLEMDCVEEKRKITDEICVKNEIGYNMSKNTKYKILAQASPEEREEFLSLLWKDGSAPNSIRKYVIRKRLKLKPYQNMLNVNRECEKMYADGVDEAEIAKFYLGEKRKTEKEILRYKRILKEIRLKNENK